MAVEGLRLRCLVDAFDLLVAVGNDPLAFAAVFGFERHARLRVRRPSQRSSMQDFAFRKLCLRLLTQLRYGGLLLVGQRPAFDSFLLVLLAKTL
jgi:hypothetical protein